MNFRIKKSIRKLSGFTLVELIVVISILAILGTIGIISLLGYQNSARDSVRVSDIKSIQKWLSIFYVKSGVYPLPENSIEIDAGGAILSYQGYAGDNVSRIININKIPLDPKDTTRYIYTIDSTKKKAQLMGYLESGDTLKITAYSDLFSRLINQSYAATSSIDYKSRFVYVTGDKIGVLTNGNKAPLQESITGTGIDLSTTDTTGYVAYFWGAIYGTWQSTGTGDILITQIQWALTDTIPCNPLSYSGYIISALAHNQTQVFTKPLTIANGTWTGSLQIQCLNGVLDTLHAIETSNIGCNTNYVNQAGSCVLDVCGGTVPTSAHSTATSQTISQNWVRATIAGICTFDCDANYTWNSGTSTCIANTQSMSCTGLPSNGIWNTVSSITQTWNGSSWTPSTTGIYNTTTSTTSCNYACNTGFHTENAWVSCISNTQSCAITNGVGSQTWNTGTSTWNACTVVSCNSGFMVSGNSCMVSNFTFNQTISTNTQNYNLKAAAIAAGWNQVLPLNATITVNAGVYVWSDSTALAAFDGGGALSAGSTVTLINNGYIMGKGGKGCGYSNTNGENGGNAMNITAPIIINSTSGYILGGGGGGAGNYWVFIYSGYAGGGGGAGGGAGGDAYSTSGPQFFAGGVGGSLGNNGNSGAGGTATGGGGGRVMPNATTIGPSITTWPATIAGYGGGGGGTGYASVSATSITVIGGSGGGVGNIGGNAYTSGSIGCQNASGGGGGWGAAGGYGVGTQCAGTLTWGIPGAGGKAINTNGNSITWTSGSQPATVYGAVN